MRNIDADNITQAVIARHAAAGDARAREVMTSLVQHLHAFARDVRLTEAEWAEGIVFLTECGQLCSDRRQEFVALSDTLGLSTLVTALHQRQPQGCTEATAPGPFDVRDAPRFEHGDDLARDADGEPFYMHGRVRALDGTPVAGAEVRVWQCDASGQYDAPSAGLPTGRACGMLVTGAAGEFHFRSVVAAPHAVPHDGPVGRMLDALGRQPWRPAHLHFRISAPGHQPLVTQVFRKGDPHLDTDAAFGVRRSLLADWVHHAPGRTPDGQASAVPFTTLEFEFVLNTTTGDKA